MKEVQLKTTRNKCNQSLFVHWKAKYLFFLNIDKLWQKLGKMDEILGKFRQSFIKNKHNFEQIWSIILGKTIRLTIFYISRYQKNLLLVAGTYQFFIF